MSNQKIENLLNLALETPESIREKSLNLNVGYEEVGNTWELIVKYNGDLSVLRERGIIAEELIAGYAILTVPEAEVDSVAALPQIEYVEKPKRLFFAVERGKDASCIPQVTMREPYLSGEGVLVAVIDSGIDYTNDHFRSPNGNTRILYLWDQTVFPDEVLDRRPPEGFALGTEFDRVQIDRALQAANPMARFNLVPSIDVSGHGTAVAGIAAGSGVNGYEGVAPESGLIVVKLGIAGENSFPRTTELMRAVTYVVKKAQELGMPVAINLSFGNTYGAHDGTSLVERFLDNAAEIGRAVICVGSGNEGASGGHIQGDASLGRQVVELAVAQYETMLNVQLWKNYVDSYRIFLRSPGGEEILLPELGQGKLTLLMEDTEVLIYLGEPTPYGVTQEVYFDFIPRANYINTGIWSFTIEPLDTVTGQYYFYLPSAGVRNRNTRFFASTPQMTLTIPSTAGRVITVGAYDSTYESYADFSGRGYVYPQRTVGLVAAGAVKPDLVAPGVNITAPDTIGGYGTFTGTSFATPFVTGAAALLMEWGIVRGNDVFLYGEKVKAYLRRGARPLRGEGELPNARVGFGALCLADSLPV
ncbi:MAG: S8 family serine peptidase [Lachnospiraceae bacterium]|nr:S8 family serine peptidase [Lachnospiraceae bacterium]